MVGTTAILKVEKKVDMTAERMVAHWVETRGLLKVGLMGTKKAEKTELLTVET